MSTSKEKRTKEQIMSLLGRAIEQEEVLLAKVHALEAELANCRVKAENPRHEWEERALPGSKISFRLDYYRTEKKGPVKGIIEHLPTRDCQSFEGDRFDPICEFISRFVGTRVKPPKSVERLQNLKISPNFPPEIMPAPEALEKKERSPLLKKLFPEFFAPPPPVQAKPLPDASGSVAERLGAGPFLILTEGAKNHQRSVRKGQSFQIEIPMQALDAFQGKPCYVSLSASSLEKKSAKRFESQEYCTPDQDALRLPVRAFPIEQGVYRLVVSMTLRDEPKTSYYREDRVLIVQ